MTKRDDFVMDITTFAIEPSCRGGGGDMGGYLFLINVVFTFASVSVKEP